MKKILIILTLLFTSFTLFACDLLDDSTIQEERQISIDAEEQYFIDTFDITTITITIDYGDGRIDSEHLTTEMLDETSVALLDEVGTHTLEGRYLGLDFSFEVTLLESALDYLTALLLLIEPTEFMLTEDIVIPSFEATEGLSYHWHSSHPEYLNTDGTVTRPSVETGDVAVTLTLTLTYEDASKSKAIVFTVLADDKQTLDYDLDASVYTDFAHLMDDVSLNTNVDLAGLVTHSNQAGFIIFDGTQNIFVYNRYGTIPNAGTYVLVNGVLSQYETMIQISKVETIEIIDTDVPLPTPTATPLSLEALHSLNPSDPTLVGKSFLVQGTLTLSGTFSNVTIIDGEYSLVVYYLSPENAIDALKQHIGDTVEIEVLFYTDHHRDGLLVIFDQTLSDITVISPGDDDDTDDPYDPDVYFLPDYDMVYDGPRLDMDFLNIAPAEYDADEGKYVGTGGAYYVTYDPANGPSRCIDGDTTVFEYPPYVYDLIINNAKSTRYFNIDTPETWPFGAEEEWGATATVYVCEMLSRAESIIIQSDPGDNFLDIHNRLLGWIWIRMPGEDDYMLLNYLIVRQGLATVEYLFGAGETDTTMYAGYTYTWWMFFAENAAIHDNLGMWGSLKEYYYDYNYNRIDRDKYPH